MKAPHFSRGSALLLVMWALILLSSAVLVWARWMQHEIELSGTANREVEARAMAQSGVAVALHPLVTKQTPLLEEEFTERLGYRVRMVSEGGKLNIKWLLAEEDPRRITILKQWLERRGLGFKERETFVDCLLDYVDGDDLSRLNGMEDEGEYHPPNRPLETIDEIAEVPGSEPLTSTPGWRDELTLYSQGPIDVTSASPEVLRLLPGLSEARIQRLIIVRQGPDKLDGTLDDRIFRSLTEVQRELMLNDAQFQELAPLIKERDETIQIISEGRSGEVVRQIEVIARKSGPNPTIWHWKE